MQFFHTAICRLLSGYLLLILGLVISLHSSCKSGSSGDGDPVLSGNDKMVPVTPISDDSPIPGEQTDEPVATTTTTPDPLKNTTLPSGNAKTAKINTNPSPASNPSSAAQVVKTYPPANNANPITPAAVVAEVTKPADKPASVYTPPVKTDPALPVAAETPKPTKVLPAAPAINRNKIKVDLQQKLIELSRKPRDSRLMSDIRGYFANTKQAGVISTDKRQYSVEQYLVTVNMSGEMDIHVADINVDNAGKITQLSIEQTELK